MPRFAANISLLFTELPFLERFEAAAAAGFKGVEFLFPYAFDAREIKSRLDDNGLELVLFNIHPGDWDKAERGLTALQGREQEFKTAVDQALDFAGKLGCTRLHAMAGLIKDGANRDTYLKNLRLASKAALPMGIDILIEPINTHDFPGYFLNTTKDAADVIEAVGAPNLHLQLDLYHRHMSEGDVEKGVREFSHLARHYQVAGPPDRFEPHPSEMDCTTLFKIIDDTGYNGWIGCEYKPRTTTLDGLRWLAACGIELI